MDEASLPNDVPEPWCVRLGQEHEVRYWTQAFDVTAAELRNALDAVGPVPAAVRGYLGR